MRLIPMPVIAQSRCGEIRWNTLLGGCFARPDSRKDQRLVTPVDSGAHNPPPNRRRHRTQAFACDLRALSQTDVDLLRNLLQIPANFATRADRSVGMPMHQLDPRFTIAPTQQGNATALGAKIDGNQSRPVVGLISKTPPSVLRRWGSGGPWCSAPGAAQEEDRGRAVPWIDRLVGQRPLGVDLRQQGTQLLIGEASAKGMLYFASEALTRSRGNMVEPLTTVAGLIPLTRTLGDRVTASSRTRWLTAALLTS